MPSIRVGFSTDLNIIGGLTGIGTTNPAARLDVAGQIAVEDTASSGGVSTFREYQGFSQVQAKITNNTLIDNGDRGPSSSLAGEIKITGETTVSSGSTVEVGKTKTLTVTDKFAVPLGDTNTRDNAPEAGTIRFNQDFGTLEFFDGANWWSVNSYNRGGAAGRAVFAGGYHGGSGALTHMGYVQISTFGNSMYFGDLNQAQYDCDGHGNETRGIISAGQGDNDLMQYITIASAGNAINFGDLIQDRGWTTCAGSSTRKLTAGGYFNPTSRDQIEYVEMSTTGDAQDFGDLSQARYGMAGMNSSVKCVFAGGYKSPGISIRQDTVNTSSKGNAVEFGKMTRYHAYPAAGSSSTRGLVAGGAVTAIQGVGDNIDMVTFASDGEHVDFGNLTESKRLPKGASSNTRMVIFAGSNTVPSPNASLTNTIEYITIASSGNGFDFGDMTGKDIFDPAALSDCHGGLGGF